MVLIKEGAENAPTILKYILAVTKSRKLYSRIRSVRGRPEDALSTLLQALLEFYLVTIYRGSRCSKLSSQGRVECIGAGFSLKV